MSDSAGPMIPALLRTLHRETTLTRRALERLPDGRFDWQPHPKSMTLGELASHIAETLSYLHDTFSTSHYDLSTATPAAVVQPATTRTELLARFDAHATAAHVALAATDEAALAHEWTMSHGDQIIFRQPRAQIVRELLFDHLIHHRGQLTVYLRLLDIPVPGLYGPTADEPEFDFELAE